MGLEPRSERDAATPASSDSRSRRVTLAGVLSRAIFEAADDSYTVAELQSKGETHVVAGDLSGCAIGDTVEIEGEPIVHPRFGRQLRVWSVRWVPPASREGLRRFLASGAFAGIGEKLAGRIVEAFGEETLRVLDQEPQRLGEVPGVGRKKAAALAQAFAERRAQNVERAFLAGLGLGPAMVERVRKTLIDDVAARVRADPWRLAREVEGIGFRRADEIARRLDVRADAPERIDAGLEFALRELADAGHVCAPRARLVEAARALLSLPAGPIEDRIAPLLERGAIRREPLDGDEAIYLPRLHAAEVEVARTLLARLGDVGAGELVDPARAVEWVKPRLGFELTDDQRAAVAALFNRRTGVLTGGPGVGKTTIVRALVEVFARRGLRLALAAPTGRAARRLADACGRDASTIHRLLEFDPRRGVFQRDRSTPLELDALIVDESSMIDLPLLRDLLRALPGEARLLLVGDADQLPSVGPGDVLRSLVGSGRVPVARLTRILRQSERSSIVRAAHAVLRGEMPGFERTEGAGDSSPRPEGAYFIQRDDPGAAQRAAVEIVTGRLPRRFGFDPLRSVQVLTPMNRGPLGVHDLNEALQRALNPGAKTPLAAGDRVIQTRNDYDLGVMNGEIGFVTERDERSGELAVDFEDRVVRYPARAAADLQPAYAITVHKSQGCEFEAVVLVLSMQHFVLLRRNLLYTAITRARRVLVVIGAPRALQTAVEMGAAERRFGLLERRLREAGGGAASP